MLKPAYAIKVFVKNSFTIRVSKVSHFRRNRYIDMFSNRVQCRSIACGRGYLVFFSIETRNTNCIGNHPMIIKTRLDFIREELSEKKVFVPFSHFFRSSHLGISD